MKRFLSVGCLLVAALGLVVVPGCDREIASEREVEIDNGERIERETEVRETNDGVEIEESERRVDRDNGTTEEEEVEVERRD